MIKTILYIVFLFYLRNSQHFHHHHHHQKLFQYYLKFFGLIQLSKKL